MRAAQTAAARRQRVLLASGAVAVVLVVVVALVVLKLSGVGGGSDGDSAGAAGDGSGGKVSTRAAGQVVRDVTSVPPSVLDSIGVGGAQAAPKKVDAPALETAAGLPRVLYVGAEFCPYCAAQRWPVVVALSRFGTWSGLGATHSASEDVYPDTQTLSFHGATFTSDHVSFTGVETTTNERQGNSYAPLDTVDAADQKVVDAWNKQPYTGGGIPFLDIGGRYVTSGASYSPELLAGRSRAEIAAALHDPTSDIAKAVDGTANVLTATICEATGGQPADVCTSPGVTAAATAVAGAQTK